MYELPPPELAQEYDQVYYDIETSTSSSSNYDDDSARNTATSSSKRKRAPKELLLRVNKDIRWESYMPTSIPPITLLDRNSLLPIVPIVQVGQIDKSAIVEGDMCGIFRQNQFKLQCILQGPLSDYTTSITPELMQSGLVGYITSQPHQLMSVDGLFFHLYAFRQTGDSIESSADFVPLHQVGPSRTKRDTQPPELMPVTNGSGIFDKLQFQASTHLSSGTHFRAVVCLIAKVMDKLYAVNASISPKFIVHARNPGRCAGKLTKKPNTSGDSPTQSDETSPQTQLTPPQASFTTTSQPPFTTTTQPSFTTTSQPSFTTTSQPFQVQQIPSTTLSSQEILSNAFNNQHFAPIPLLQPGNPMSGLQPQIFSAPPTITTTVPSPPQYMHTPPLTQHHPPSPVPPYSTLAPQYTHSPTPSPPQLFQQIHESSITPYTPPDNTKESSSSDRKPPGWQETGETTYFYGRVGINTNSPQESLTVNGNIMVTGNVLKPSDIRLKENFSPVSSAVQLNVINNIRIYDYDIHSNEESKRRERGVIAQEVAKLLPSAVHQLGDYTTQNGQTIENLLVVNERVLLLENIGATQYLNQMLDQEREELDQVANKVQELEDEEKKNSSYLMSTLQAMSQYVFSEGFREGDPDRDSWIHCGFSLFGLGPAWSMFLLGFICPPVWLLGTLYMSAKSPVKRAAGTANFCMLLLAIMVLLGIPFLYKYKMYRLTVLLLVIGVVFLVIVIYFKWRRSRIRTRIMKAENAERLKKMKEAVAEPGKPTNVNVNKRQTKSVVLEV